MRGATAGAVGRRRPYPGAAFELSALTVTVPSSSRGLGEALTVELLRRAREAGVTTFDTAGAASPEIAEGWLARAFPGGDPTLVVLTAGQQPPVSPGLPHGQSMPLPPPRLGDGAREGGSARRDRFRRLYEVPFRGHAPQAEASPTGPPPGEGLAPAAVRCTTAEEAREAATAAPPKILSGPFSLLNPSIADAAARVAGPDALAWIARDPFAGGRLDGSRSPLSPPGVLAAPRSLRDLEAEFEPLSRLAFLAVPRRRTLAQAALHFVLGNPWVATACVPLPSPERWTEILGYEGSPPLNDEERRRAVALGSRPTEPTGAGGESA